MGCCTSKFHPTETHPEKEKALKGGPSNPPLIAGPDATGVPPFSELLLADLKAATNNFSSDFIVSESGEKAPNVVYKGRLQSRRWIAVKKFPKLSWPDPQQFAVLYYYNCSIYVYILMI